MCIICTVLYCVIYCHYVYNMYCTILCDILGTTPSAAFINSSSNVHVGCGNRLVESWRGNFTEQQRDNDGWRFFLGGSSRSID